MAIDSCSPEASRSARAMVFCAFVVSVVLLAACASAARLPDPLEAGWEGASV